MDDRIKRLLSRLEDLRQVRRPHEKRMEDAIRFVLPYHHSMDTQKSVDDWTDERYDTTATESATTLADGMLGNLCPPTLKWFSYRAAKNEANDSMAVKMWLQEVDERIMEALSRSNFYDMSPTIFKHAVSMETVAVAIDKDPESQSGIVSILPPREVYVVNDAYGRVEAVFREYAMTAEQAWNMFPEEEQRKKFTFSLRESAEKSPDTAFEFVTVVRRRHNIDPEDDSAKNWPWESLTFQPDGEEVIDESSFRTIPILVWRWELRGRDPYGYGLTTEAMPTVKTINEIARTLITVAQKTADPPVFVPEYMADADEFSLEPGTINFYRDPGLRPFPFAGGQGYPINKDILEAFKESIRTIYKTRYFLMLMQMEEPGRTAYEIRERKVEKITAMGSIVGRCQQEFLTPLLARFFWIEYEAGRIEPAPPELQESGLMIDYIGPFAQAQKEVTQTSGVITGLQNVEYVIRLDPGVIKKIRLDVAAEELLTAAGFPAKAIVPKEEYQAIKEQEAQAQALAQQQQMLVDAGKASEAFKERPVPNSIASQLLGLGG